MSAWNVLGEFVLLLLAVVLRILVFGPLVILGVFAFIILMAALI